MIAMKNMALVDGALGLRKIIRGLVGVDSLRTPLDMWILGLDSKGDFGTKAMRQRHQMHASNMLLKI